MLFERILPYDSPFSAIKTKIQIEISMLFEDNSLVLIERNTGVIFDPTDPDQDVTGLSSFILSRIMVFLKEKAYLTTTGYSRNMMRFTKE